MKVETKRFLPWWWYFIVLPVLAAAGVGLIWYDWQAPQVLGKLSKRVRPDAWSTFGGILILSVVITHLVIFTASRLSRWLLKLHGDDTHADMWSPALVGICESFMYPMALFLGKPEFIGVWLAVKVAGQWVRWKGDAGHSPSGEEPDLEKLEKLNEGRRRFNSFLVGNALSIMLGAATWGVLKIWVLL